MTDDARRAAKLLADARALGATDSDRLSITFEPDPDDHRTGKFVAPPRARHRQATGRGRDIRGALDALDHKISEAWGTREDQ